MAVRWSAATALLIAMACSVSASPLTDHFLRIEVQRIDDRPTIAAVVMDEEGDGAWIDPAASSARLQGRWYVYPTEDMELVLTARDSSLEYVVEQRLVTYLNLISDDDVVTIDLETSTPWTPLRKMAPRRWQMNPLETPDIDLTAAQLVEVVRRQAPEHVALAQKCTGFRQPPCELVTDHELNIFVQRSGGRELVGTIRLYEK